MIGRLSGTLLEKRAPDLMVDVSGVGYELQAPLSTFDTLPEDGAAVCLYTHLVVREDAQLLYGFGDRQSREMFRSLIRVNGVGPKLALAILSGMDARAFAHCVHSGDTTALIKLPGVGRKTAERLLVEMADRLGDWEGADLAIDSAQRPAVSSVAAGQRALKQEAESALLALGYKPAEAAQAINAVCSDAVDSSETLIRLALRAMAA